MKRFQLLVQERADLIAEGKKLTEKDEALSDEGKARFEVIKARVKEIDPELKILEEQREMERNAPTLPTANPAPISLEPAPTTSVSVHNRADDDPNRGFRTPRDFMFAVIDAARTMRPDERLKPLRISEAAGSDEGSTISDPYGGFLVPVGFSPNMLTIRPEDDILAGRTTRIPMANPVVKMPARVDTNHSDSVAGGLSVSRKAETAAASASRMQFQTVALTAFSLFGFSYATEELLQDSAISFAAMLASSFSQVFTDRILYERIHGSGVGEFKGILSAAAKIEIAKETSQTADTLKGANIVKMRSRCWGYSNSIWMANHDTLTQLAEVSLPGTNTDSFLFVPERGTDVPATLMGRPIFFTEYCATLGDVGDIILVNWGEYLEGVYSPMNNAESIHVRFANHERAFKFWLRNAGTPWWLAALTPRVSTTTMSPYVTLAARA